MQDEVVGSCYAINDNGWIAQKHFYWLREHFLQNAIAYRLTLLFLDSYCSQLELNSIQLVRQNDVILFYLPTHATHVCQPLECSFFGPLKKHWQQECNQFIEKSWKVI